MKKIIRVSVDLNDPSSFPKGFVDKKLVDATSERLIKLHQQQGSASLLRSKHTLITNRSIYELRQGQPR